MNYTENNLSIWVNFRTFVEIILKIKLKTALQNIATIQSGIYVTTEFSGEIVYLQANNFNEDGQLSTTLVPNLFLTNQTQRHLLQPGDILFAAKGTKNFATVYEEHNGPCVASSTFLVIRLKEDLKDKVKPDFIAWFINHPNTQKWLKANAIGSALPSISKTVLSGLDISIPAMSIQKSILKIDALRLREKQLQNQLINLKDIYVQHLLQNALN